MRLLARKPCTGEHQSPLWNDVLRDRRPIFITLKLEVGILANALKTRWSFVNYQG
jgi:hypothetical protein